MFRFLLPIAFALVAAGAGVSNAQPVPAGPANARFAPHPYKSALGAIANYQACGVRARGADVARLEATLRASEAAARAKGLGPMLDQLYRDWQAELAVSTMMGCVHGPAAALAGARTTLRAFQTWVAAQPPAR